MNNLLNELQNDTVNDLLNGKKIKKNKKAQLQMSDMDRNNLLTKILSSNTFTGMQNNDTSSSSSDPLTKREELRQKLRNKMGTQKMLRNGKKALEQQLQHKMKDVLKDSPLMNNKTESVDNDPVPELIPDNKEDNLDEYLS